MLCFWKRDAEQSRFLRDCWVWISSTMKRFSKSLKRSHFWPCRLLSLVYPKMCQFKIKVLGIPGFDPVQCNDVTKIKTLLVILGKHQQYNIQGLQGLPKKITKVKQFSWALNFTKKCFLSCFELRVNDKFTLLSFQVRHNHLVVSWDAGASSGLIGPGRLLEADHWAFEQWP